MKSTEPVLWISMTYIEHKLLLTISRRQVKIWACYGYMWKRQRRSLNIYPQTSTNTTGGKNEYNGKFGLNHVELTKSYPLEDLGCLIPKGYRESKNRNESCYGYMWQSHTSRWSLNIYSRMFENAWWQKGCSGKNEYNGKFSLNHAELTNDDSDHHDHASGVG